VRMALLGYLTVVTGLVGMLAGCAGPLGESNPGSSGVTGTSLNASTTATKQAFTATNAFRPGGSQPGEGNEITLTSGITDNAVTQSISSTFKKAGDGLSAMFASDDLPPARASDPVLLSSKSKPPGPDLYVSVARVYIQSNKLLDAEQQYMRALRIDPTHLVALQEYGRLKGIQGELGEAAKLYEKAARNHPSEASPMNGLGLCLARLGRRDEAHRALLRGVQLAPRVPLYRNNLAILLVDMGRSDEAFPHLLAAAALTRSGIAPDEAVAHFNLGYLLEKKGDSKKALQHFVAASQKAPAWAPARERAQRLQAMLGGVRQATRPPAPPTTRAGSGRPAPNTPASTTPAPTAVQSGNPLRDGNSAGTLPVGPSGYPGSGRQGSLRRLPPPVPRHQLPPIPPATSAPAASNTPPATLPPRPAPGVGNALIEPLPPVNSSGASGNPKRSPLPTTTVRPAESMTAPAAPRPPVIEPLPPVTDR